VHRNATFLFFFASTKSSSLKVFGVASSVVLGGEDAKQGLVGRFALMRLWLLSAVFKLLHCMTPEEDVRRRGVNLA